MNQTSESIVWESRGPLRVLTFNRPEQRNSLPPAGWIELARMLDELNADADARVLVLRGAGERAFSTGYDINALQELEQQGIVLSTPEDPFEIALAALLRCHVPTIAMVRGYAVGGGCTFAVGCDLRIAGKGARFGMPPAKLGLVYSLSELRPFVELIGHARTKMMFYSGRIFDSAQSQALGLVEQVVEDAELEEYTFSLAEEIAANAPRSVQGTKRLLRLLSDADVHHERRREARSVILATNTGRDLQEGIRAFVEKRKPEFTGQ
ncbi:MAG: enoyl-CoA hydratase-related protein [Chloroflexota bacterium]